MIHLHARKMSLFRTVVAVAAVLLNGAAAFAAGTFEDGHAQARSLLSAAAAVRAQRASTAMPAVAADGLVDDGAAQARCLLDASHARRGSDRNMTGASPIEDTVTTYAGADVSARRMILGHGA